MPDVVEAMGDTRRVLGVAVPERRVWWAMAAFAAVCIVLVGWSPQQRVGDAGEYMAMSWNITHFRPPALTEEDIVRLDQHLAELEPGLKDYRGSVPRLPSLWADGRYDMLHFWMYPLLASPFVGVANVLDVPDTYGFAAFNLLLVTLVFGIVLRRRGALAAVVLCCSPWWWWIDKPHTELLIVSMIVLALLWRHDRPRWGMAAMAVAMSQNISIGPAFGIYCLAVAVEHRRALVATARHWWVLAGVAAIALVHPLYYFWRFGSYDATVAGVGQGLRIPTVTRMVTPIVDPYAGLLMWWPGLLAVAAVGGTVMAWRRVPRRRTAADWFVVWAPFLVAVAILFGQAQNKEPAAGGTFAMLRFAVWMSAFAVFGLHRDAFRGRVLRPLAVVIVAGSVALSLHVARPSRPDVWYTVRPTWVADLLNEHAPWAWDPPPQVFLTRQWRMFTPIEPVANDACTKLLGVSGRWPEMCDAPADVPADCAQAWFCYANWNGDGWWFRAEDDIG